MRQLLSLVLPDQLLERVRSNFVEVIRELQASLFVGGRLLKDVSLGDGVETPIAHGLGRAPQIVLTSPVRDPRLVGMIEELRSTGHDRSRFIVLKASGYDQAITVDVVAW
jgi:hypothetical protein